MISEQLRFASERGEPIFSFEFFPPKSEAGVEALFAALRALHPLAPAFVSMTWGAGGSTSGRSLELVTRIKREIEIETLAHLTCVGVSKAELIASLHAFREAGIGNVLALRGDPPKGQREFVAHPGGFSFAAELVSLARETLGGAGSPGKTICLGAACYPEGHIETKDPGVNLAHLKAKVEAGADFLITQLFFDNQKYFDFVGRARASGITVPIIPGIMPITNVDQVQRFTALCGATVPPKLQAAMRVRRDDPEGSLQLGVAWATLQCADLLRKGAPGIHFYTLNRSPATRAILAALRAMEPWREI